MPTSDTIKLAVEYLKAVERKEFRRVVELLVPDLQFFGPSHTYSTAETFIASLERLAVLQE